MDLEMNPGDESLRVMHNVAADLAWCSKKETGRPQSSWMRRGIFAFLMAIGENRALYTHRMNLKLVFFDALHHYTIP